MIAFIRGPIALIDDDGCLVIDKGGLGLAVAVPLSMLQPAPAVGEEITLHTHLQIKEDGWQLYGFGDKEQLRVFRLLLSVSGVGAKTALAIVDKIAVARWPQIMAAKEVKPLTNVSGVGKKTAERILLELKDKFPVLSAGGALPEGGGEETFDQLDRDLLAALRQLGYSATEARAFALQAVTSLGPQAGSEVLLREALKIAMRS